MAIDASLAICQPFDQWISQVVLLLFVQGTGGTTGVTFQDVLLAPRAARPPRKRREMVTMAENETAAATQFVVNDELGPQELHGRLLAKCVWSYEEAYEHEQVRWTDLVLYRNADMASRNRYVLQTVARSVVYHLPGGRCRRGRRAPVSFLRRDEARYEALAACTKCSPPDLNDLSENFVVSVEQDFPHLDLFPDATELLKPLRSTALHAKLIQQAVLADEDIARALRGRRL